MFCKINAALRLISSMEGQEMKKKQQKKRNVDWKENEARGGGGGFVLIRPISATAYRYPQWHFWPQLIGILECHELLPPVCSNKMNACGQNFMINCPLFPMALTQSFARRRWLTRVVARYTNFALRKLFTSRSRYCPWTNIRVYFALNGGYCFCIPYNELMGRSR